MCGLLGFSRLTPITRQLLGVLSIEMDKRGSQSWGLTNGSIIYKETGSIIDKYDHQIDQLGDGQALLVHTRAASVGSVSQANAHPFEFIAADGFTVRGAHNGHIANYWSVKDKYKSTRHACEVDSQQIFASLAEHTPLGELEGWGTMVWWEQLSAEAKPLGPFISTFSRGDLAIAKLTTGEVVFASTKSAIEKAVRFAPATGVDFFYDLTAKHKYELRGDEVFDDGALPWGECPLSQPAVIVTPAGFNQSSGKAAARECRFTNCTNKLAHPTKQLLCDECFDKMLTELFGSADTSKVQSTWTA